MKKQCIICGKVMTTSSYNEPVGGVKFTGTPGYESKFDMMGDFEISVCDDCIKENECRINVFTKKILEPKIKYLGSLVCS